MLNPHEYFVLVDMERNGTELTKEAKLEMAKYDEPQDTPIGKEYDARIVR